MEVSALKLLGLKMKEKLELFFSNIESLSRAN